MQTHFLLKSDRQLSEAINEERRESFNPSRTIRSPWEDFFDVNVRLTRLSSFIIITTCEPLLWKGEIKIEGEKNIRIET